MTEKYVSLSERWRRQFGDDFLQCAVKWMPPQDTARFLEEYCAEMMERSPSHSKRGNMSLVVENIVHAMKQSPLNEGTAKRWLGAMKDLCAKQGFVMEYFFSLNIGAFLLDGPEKKEDFSVVDATGC